MAEIFTGEGHFFEMGPAPLHPSGTVTPQEVARLMEDLQDEDVTPVLAFIAKHNQPAAQWLGHIASRIEKLAASVPENTVLPVATLTGGKEASTQVGDLARESPFWAYADTNVHDLPLFTFGIAARLSIAGYVRSLEDGEISVTDPDGRYVRMPLQSVVFEPGNTSGSYEGTFQAHASLVIGDSVKEVLGARKGSAFWSRFTETIPGLEN